MSKYRVLVTAYATTTFQQEVIVEADNEDAANDLACTEANERDAWEQVGGSRFDKECWVEEIEKIA